MQGAKFTYRLELDPQKGPGNQVQLIEVLVMTLDGNVEARGSGVITQFGYKSAKIWIVGRKWGDSYQASRLIQTSDHRKAEHVASLA